MFYVMEHLHSQQQGTTLKFSPSDTDFYEAEMLAHTMASLPLPDV